MGLNSMQKLAILLDFDDIVYGHILGMDTYALGLIKAQELIEDGRIDQFIEDRYSGYTKGIGKRSLMKPSA